MQADLNWNNPKVVNELKHILKYYVNMGVEGFRFDSFEEVDKTLLPDAQAHPNNNRYDFTHGPNIDKMYHQIFQGLPSNIYLLGEIDSNTGDDFYKHTDQTKTFDAVYTDDMNSFNSDLYNEDDQANINQIINLYNKLTTYSNLKGTIAKLFECHDNHHPINRFVG
jgi:glycosidase